MWFHSTGWAYFSCTFYSLAGLGSMLLDVGHGYRCIYINQAAICVFLFFLLSSEPCLTARASIRLLFLWVFEPLHWMSHTFFSNDCAKHFRDISGDIPWNASGSVRSDPRCSYNVVPFRRNPHPLNAIEGPPTVLHWVSGWPQWQTMSAMKE